MQARISTRHNKIVEASIVRRVVRAVLRTQLLPLLLLCTAASSSYAEHFLAEELLRDPAYVVPFKDGAFLSTGSFWPLLFFQTPLLDSKVITSYGSVFLTRNSIAFFSTWGPNDGFGAGDLWSTGGNPESNAVILDLGSILTGEIWLPTVNTDPGNSTYLLEVLDNQGIRIYRSDGTLVGTEQLVNLPSIDRQTTRIQSLYQFNGKYLWAQSDRDTGANLELWATDGTDLGTLKLLPTSGMTFRLGGGEYVLLKNAFYLLLRDNTNALGLWRTDGTPEGTFRLTDFGLTNATTNEGLESSESYIYTTVTCGTCADKQLWRSDGTIEGTVMVPISNLLHEKDQIVAAFDDSVLVHDRATMSSLRAILLDTGQVIDPAAPHRLNYCDVFHVTKGTQKTYLAMWASLDGYAGVGNSDVRYSGIVAYEQETKKLDFQTCSFPEEVDFTFYEDAAQVPGGFIGVTGDNTLFFRSTLDTCKVFENALQSADMDGDYAISLPELLRTVQFYNSSGYYCAEVLTDTEDGYVPGPGANHACTPYDTDYNPQDWQISMPELLRVIQFYNSLGYHYCPLDGTEDNFCPGPA